MQAHLPEGTLIAVAGGKHLKDFDAVARSLDKVRAKYGRDRPTGQCSRPAVLARPRRRCRCKFPVSVLQYPVSGMYYTVLRLYALRVRPDSPENRRCSQSIIAASPALETPRPLPGLRPESERRFAARSPNRLRPNPSVQAPLGLSR